MWEGRIADGKRESRNTPEIKHTICAMQYVHTQNELNAIKFQCFVYFLYIYLQNFLNTPRIRRS